MINAYPELPMVPYERTTVPMHEVISYMKAIPHLDPEIKRTSYIMFRVESSNGQSGVNNNYIGMQADSGEWPAALTHYFAGVTEEPENGTGRTRLFLTFADWRDCISCLLDRVQARGLYIGAKALPISHLLVTDETDLVRAYTKEWAQGRADAEPSADTVAAWRSMYDQAQALFRHGSAPVVPVDTSADALNNAEAKSLGIPTETST